MSGSGSSSGRDNIDSGGGGPDECGSLIVDTTLNSPVPAVVRTLKQGDRLRVEVEVSAMQVRTLVAKDASGQIAGSLTPPSLIRIITCMEGGYQYEAIVLENVAGGVVRVRIQGQV